METFAPNLLLGFLITCDKYYCNRFRGFDFVGGQNLLFFID